MAWGFDRLPGTARNYLNVSSPDYAVGKVLSRRQYSAYVKRLGQSRPIPGFEALRDAERRLEAVQDELVRSRMAETIQKQRHRRERRAAGERRFQSAVSAYIAEAERRGVTVGRREARKSAELKAIMKELKGRPNPRGNPNIAAKNRERRLNAVNKLGGWAVFREVYEALYGPSAPYTVRRGGVPVRFDSVRPDGRSARPGRRAA